MKAKLFFYKNKEDKNIHQKCTFPQRFTVCQIFMLFIYGLSVYQTKRVFSTYKGMIEGQSLKRLYIATFLTHFRFVRIQCDAFTWAREKWNVSHSKTEKVASGLFDPGFQYVTAGISLCNCP